MKKISKLKKVALMDPSTFENTVDQISDKGRAILKAIEEYKFNIDQTLRVVKNDVALTNVINQKKKNLDHAAQDLYSIVFDIENIDITQAYNEQQQDIQQNQENKDNKDNKDGEDAPPPQNNPASVAPQPSAQPSQQPATNNGGNTQNDNEEDIEDTNEDENNQEDSQK